MNVRFASVVMVPALALAGCGQAPVVDNAATNTAAANTAAAITPPVPVPKATSPEEKSWPPAPGTPGGLPDDRAALPETGRDLTGPQGAAAALETYVVNVEGKHWTRAHQQWGVDAAALAFEKRWRDVSEVHGMIGRPGDAEGACGSIYAEVPVQFYGTRLDGTRFNSVGTATMRRVNGVDGATPRQLSWHIDQIILHDTR